FFGLDVLDVPLIDFPLWYQSVRYELPQPRGGSLVVLVVVVHARFPPLPTRGSKPSATTRFSTSPTKGSRPSGWSCSSVSATVATSLNLAVVAGQSSRQSPAAVSCCCSAEPSSGLRSALPLSIGFLSTIAIQYRAFPY